MSCEHHHSDEDLENHDLILVGLAQPKRKIDKKPCMLYPDDRFALVWEIFISLILLISCTTTPVSLAFPSIEDENNNYYIFNIVIDLIFLFEIFLNFRYAFENELFQIIDDKLTIARKYMTGWFIIDVIAIAPIDFIVKYTARHYNDHSRANNSNQFVRLSRIGKLYKLTRATRLLRLVKIMKRRQKIMN